MAITFQIILWLLNIYLVNLWLHVHTQFVFVWTLSTQCCVSVICVACSAPHWPSLLPFPPSVYFGGGQVGLRFWFGKCGVNELWKSLQAGSHTKASKSLRKGWFSAGRSRLPFALVCFSKCKVSSLHWFWQSRKWDWLFVKSFSLQLVMKMHRDRGSVSAFLVDGLIALGLKYHFQDLPEALPPFQDLPEALSPEGRLLSLFIAKLLVWIYCDSWTARFCLCCSFQR